METIDITELWIRMLEKLKQSLPPQIYNTWIETSLIPYSLENNTFTLDTTTNFICSYITKKYTHLLETTASSVANQDIKVRLIHSAGDLSDTVQTNTPKKEETQYIYDNNIYTIESLKNQKTVGSVSSHTEQLQTGSETSYTPDTKQAVPFSDEKDDILQTGASTLNNTYTFDTFVVGNSNRLAHAAAMSIAESPMTKYSPFFIYGDSGLGKTHLMHAIGHYILNHYPNLRLRCITSEDFANELIQSIQDKNPESFRQRYRNIDVLLVDDIQFLESKEHTQEEFFHTFNKLYKDHKQMVFTSDRPPQNIKKLEDRLRSRFQGGTVVNIDPPDLETRTAILRNRAKIEHLPIEKEAIDYIASNVSENIRELEGAFIRAQMQASVENSPITLEVTQRALQELVKTKQEKKYITIDEITKHICSYYKIKYEDLMSKTKLKKIAFPRQIAMYLCRELTEHTYPHLGAAFNDRDHTTVMYAVNKISTEIKKDDSLRKAVEQIKNSIIHLDK